MNEWMDGWMDGGGVGGRKEGRKERKIEGQKLKVREVDRQTNRINYGSEIYLCNVCCIHLVK